MKTFYSNFLFPILSGVLLMLLITQTVRLSRCSMGTTQIDTVYSVDTIYVETEFIKIVKKEVPKPYKVVQFDTIWVYESIPVDTNEIVKDYLAMKYFSDTLSDTNIVAIINDYMSGNRLISRDFRYKILKQPTIINTQTITMSCDIDGLYLGGSFGGSRNKIGFGVNASYLSVNGLNFGASYDPVNNYGSISLLKKINRRKSP